MASEAVDAPDADAAVNAPDGDAGPSFNDGTYHLVNAATGFLADVYRGSTSNGTEVIDITGPNVIQ